MAAQLISYFVHNRRSRMEAWEWESSLFSYRELHTLQTLPCDEAMDTRLLMLTSDWLDTLTKLDRQELESPRNQIAFREPRAFGKLKYLISRLHDLIYAFDPNLGKVRCIDANYRIFWHFIQRSDVAEARFAIARLASAGFGPWLEDTQRDPWHPPVAVNYHFSFELEPLPILHWENVNEDDLALTPLPRMTLTHVFPEIAQAYPESPNTKAAAAVIANQHIDGPDAEYDREDGYSFIFEWLRGIPDPCL
ncbi:hypothetical protein F4677DRAFT_461514 [Hypoxylon crocopeplum]|nr:hypothetical protein F4677DRAFT_461514 [Hypoxylon crocopeplum]